MNAIEFYNQKPAVVRSLRDDSTGLKNVHNFIKAVLIKRFVKHKSKILDLGCGQGGDLLKIKYSHPSMYVGIDSSITAITAAQVRATKIKMNCRCHFHVIDFVTNSNWGNTVYDIINSQFSIHFAFKTLEKASATLKNVFDHLVVDGLFIGTVPIHPNCRTGDEVTVKLPGDERSCKEFAVTCDDLVSMCEAHGLKLVLLEGFTPFYERAKHSDLELCQKMRAVVPPDEHNVVFCFQK